MTARTTTAKNRNLSSLVDQDGEIGEKQDRAVDAPRRNKREIRLEREIGDEGDEDDGDGLVEEDASRESADHPPPRLGPVGKLLVALARIAEVQEHDDQRGEDRDRVDCGRGVSDIFRNAERAAHYRCTLASVTALRARLSTVSAVSTRSAAR